jgi:S-adenosyl methyltransferase
VTSPEPAPTGVEPPRPPPRVDTSVPHPARRYNYWLGGKDNFQADRDSGDAVAAAFPAIRTAARENRMFMRRAVGYLAGEVGLRQFLDIGTGIPAPNNTHEIAHAIAPGSRVVYVDNDPIVMTHARALMTSAPGFGVTAYLEEDLRDYESILSHPTLRDTLDFSRPVGLLLVGILHFLADHEDPYTIVSRLVNGLPAGSYLAASHATPDFLPPGMDDVIAANSRGPAAVHLRTLEQFSRFFAGLDLVEPGVVPSSQWRDQDEPPPRPTPAEVAAYAAVARIP